MVLDEKSGKGSFRVPECALDFFVYVHTLLHREYQGVFIFRNRDFKNVRFLDD
jgi:hypothetical protein